MGNLAKVLAYWPAFWAIDCQSEVKSLPKLGGIFLSLVQRLVKEEAKQKESELFSKIL